MGSRSRERQCRRGASGDYYSECFLGIERGETIGDRTDGE